MAAPVYITNDVNATEVVIDNKATQEVAIVGYNYPDASPIRVVIGNRPGVVPIKIVGVRNVVNGETLSSSGSSESASDYILFDQFTTNESSPLLSPRACQPGPGTLNITDTGNRATISSNKLHFSAKTTDFSDPRADSSTFQRVPGRVFQVTTKGITIRAVLANVADNGRYGIVSDGSGNLLPLDDGSGVSISRSINGTTDYIVTVIERMSGALVYIQGGVYTDPTLLWTSNAGASALRVYLSYHNVAGVIDYDDVSIKDYGGISAQRFGMSAGSGYAPSSGDTFDSDPDSLIEFNWIPNTSEVLDIMFRRVDDDNTWIVRCDQSGSTTKIIEKSGGVETERATVATTWNLAQFRIMIIVDASVIRVFRNKAALGLVYTSATFNQSVRGSRVSGFTNDDITTNAFSEFVSWKIRPTGVFPPTGIMPGYIFPYGDSKTNGSGDTQPPGLGFNGYPPILCALLESSTGYGWHESPSRVGTGGANVATLRAGVDAAIAARSTAIAPTYILINAGVNDASSLPVEATWKTNYTYILDAFHTQWPIAKIYCMRVWSRGNTTNCNTLASWLADVISTRDSFTFVGPDERVFLENGDNGVTYTTDGIHPNRPGYILTANQWKTSLGL